MNKDEKVTNNLGSRMYDESGIVIQDNTGLPTPTIEEKHKMLDEKLDILLEEIYGSNDSENLDKPRIR